MQADPNGIAYFQNAYRPLAECQVPINTHALQYGTGCFEGIRAYWDGQACNILFMREHFKRLAANARMLMMEPPSVDQMCEVAVELIRRNKTAHNVYLRPVVYKDSVELGPVMHGIPDGFMCYVIPLNDYLDTNKGLDLCISSWVRISDNQIPTRAKATGGYINSALAKSEAKSNGYDEAILLNTRGQVSEGSAENVFLVRDGVLITPDKTADILEGITRSAVLQLAADLGYRTEERSVSRTELYRADEMFLVGTGCQISWVRSLDRRVIGNGSIGPMTQRIQTMYEDAVYNRDPERVSWLTPVTE